MPGRARVEIVGIKNVATGDDFPLGVGGLEIYGHLGVWRIRRDAAGTPQDLQNFIPWNFQRDVDAVSIEEGSVFLINSTSPDFFVDWNEELWIGGHLKEADPVGPNDSMGDVHIMLRHDNIRTDRHEVHFSESQQRAAAIFNVMAF